MNEIARAIPENTENVHQDAECSFVVQVQEPKEVNLRGTNKRNEVGCNTSTPGGTPHDFSYRNGAEKVSQFHAKPFYLKASCKAERDQWINDINTAVRTFQRVKADEMNLRNSTIHRQQFRLRSIFTSFAFQTATSFLVALNFFVTVKKTYREFSISCSTLRANCWQLSQSQMEKDTESFPASFFDDADTVFASLFTAELLFNMASNLFWPFFTDIWNWFDMVCCHLALFPPMIC